MTLGTLRRAGEDRFSSQLVTVSVATPMIRATSFWSRLRSSRRFLRWSPIVLSCVG